MNRLAFLLLTAYCVLFLGCSQSVRKIVDGYYLERFDENGMYYLIASGDSSNGGVFDGTIQETGWNRDWILARVTRLYHGDVSGWYALDLKAKQVIGPIQESELKTNTAFSEIVCRDAAEAFSDRSVDGVGK